MATVEEICAEAMQLSEEDRWKLVDALYASLPAEADDDRQVIEDMQHRIAQFKAGEIEEIDGEQMMRELRERYR